MPAKPNLDLVKQLKEMLALAEKGAITNGTLVGFGDELEFRNFAVPDPKDMLTMIGHIAVFEETMKGLVIQSRFEHEQARAAGIVGRPKPAFQM